MKPLRVQINKSCNENWQNMPVDEVGRFCQLCNKTVVDFENYTDEQLFNYFNNHTNFCGRFKNSQLDKPILPTDAANNKPLLKTLSSKAAALFFTLLSFKQSIASSPEISLEFKEVEESKPERIAENRIVKIKIIDDLKKPVSGVSVFLENIKVGESDSKGECTIRINQPLLKSHTVSFSKNNHRSTAVSYHPLMGNTSFNIEMWNFATVDCRAGFSMGAPIIAHFDDIYLGKIILDKKGLPSKENKKALSALADKLRSHPNVNVILKYYYDRDKMTSIKKGHVLINYMVDQLGIDKGRFKLSIFRDRKKKSNY